jgi:hypothetical protein
MSWTCPHQIKEGVCGLRNKKCQAGAKGCVLEGMVQDYKSTGSPRQDEAAEIQSKGKSNK